MLKENLFEEVLLNPAVEGGADCLCVVSGYATAAMAFHHFQELREKALKGVMIRLVVGMTPADGISKSNHEAFKSLMEQQIKHNFECSYLIDNLPVHSKVYAWLSGERPTYGFLGSANYTQQAFCLNRQQEVLESCEPKEAIEYFRELQGKAVYCTHPDAQNVITVFNDRYFKQVRRFREQADTERDYAYPALDGLEHICVSLLDERGNLPERSGLNWGQRPEEGREPNQAYIRLPAEVYRTDFFPPRRVHFTLLTDDGKVLICTRAQDNGKAIHTPHNNSLIGEYFRYRLGVPNGARVSLNNLNRYGRTTIDFYKIDDETYFMDFSIPENNG